MAPLSRFRTYLYLYKRIYFDEKKNSKNKRSTHETKQLKGSTAGREFMFLFFLLGLFLVFARYLFHSNNFFSLERRKKKHQFPSLLAVGDLRVQVFCVCVCVCECVCASVCVGGFNVFFSCRWRRFDWLLCVVLLSVDEMQVLPAPKSSSSSSPLPFSHLSSPSLSLSLSFLFFCVDKKKSRFLLFHFFLFTLVIFIVSPWTPFPLNNILFTNLKYLIFFCVNNERTQNWLFEIVCILDPLQPPQKVLRFLLQLMNLAKVIKWKYLVDASDWTRMQKSVGLETWKSSGTHKNEEKMLKWRRNDVTTTHNRNRLKQYHEIKDVGVDNQQFIGGQWRHLAAFKRTLRSRCKSTENFGFYKTVPRKSRLPKKSP